MFFLFNRGKGIPLSPHERHVPIVESMLGTGPDHHFLGDGHACVLHKHLALLLLECVDDKWKVGIDSLIGIGDVVVEIRLADLGICSADVGDEPP